jgi:hypothetical protein
MLNFSHFLGGLSFFPYTQRALFSKDNQPIKFFIYSSEASMESPIWFFLNTGPLNSSGSIESEKFLLIWRVWYAESSPATCLISCWIELSCCPFNKQWIFILLFKNFVRLIWMLIEVFLQEIRLLQPLHPQVHRLFKFWGFCCQHRFRNFFRHGSGYQKC